MTKELDAMGLRTSPQLVADLRHLLERGLQADRTAIEGTGHPDRDEQLE